MGPWTTDKYLTWSNDKPQCRGALWYVAFPNEATRERDRHFQGVKNSESWLSVRLTQDYHRVHMAPRHLNRWWHTAKNIYAHHFRLLIIQSMGKTCFLQNCKSTLQSNIRQYTCELKIAIGDRPHCCHSTTHQQLSGSGDKQQHVVWSAKLKMHFDPKTFPAI